MLHVFLDTNILEDDPFLQRKPNLKLLVTHGKAEILIPDVVINELTKHTIKKSKESISTIVKNLKILKNIQIDNISEFQIKPYTQNEIERKYNDLQQTGLIKILSSDNIKISRIMQRYISEQKPFAENKDSFRDYILFCICVDYIHNNNLSGCYFISDNSHDFSNKDKTDFHDDLKAESQGMNYITGLRFFFECPEVKSIINQIQAEEEYEELVENWIQNNISCLKPRNGESITVWAIKNLTESNYLKELFNGKLYKSIENEVIDKCLNAIPEDFSGYFDSGYVDFESIDSIEDIDIIDFTASDDESVTISGIIKLQVEVSIYANNWCYDRDDEEDSRFICLESGYVGMEYSFDITINNDGSFDTYYDCQKIDSDLGENYNE